MSDTQQQTSDSDTITVPDVLSEGFNTFLRENPIRSSFIGSLYAQQSRGRTLSTKQWTVGMRIYREHLAKKESSGDGVEPGGAYSCNDSKLEDLVDLLKEVKINMESQPILRTNEFTIRLASERSRHAGCAYVIRDGNYVGRITPSGTAYLNGPYLGELMEVAANPKEAAITYGRKTGQCSCCGRTLTNPESIALGIGPICAGRWSF